MKMQRLSVLIPTRGACFDYLASEAIPAGRFVSVPFGRRQVIGVVWPEEPDLTVPESKLKPITGILPTPPLPDESLRFINWVAGYTLSPPGLVLKMALVPDFDRTSPHPLTFLPPHLDTTAVAFSPAQQAAADALCATIGAGFSVSVLDGVTGSGKTEVYFSALERALQRDGQVLVLLPEITLTTGFLERFKKRFGVAPAVWHSALTPKQRRDTWQAVLSGTARVIVGARSALFLPFQHLNLIVVDEEHDPSYKQEDGILYQARDMAIVRAKIADIPIILSSATPSVETMCNVQSGRFHHILLPERFAGATFPDIRIADMRRKEGSTILSPVLKQLMADKLAAGEQTLLFLNRRGYAPLVLCRACGERLQCPHCSVWLVEHRHQGCLQCHHCGYTRRLPTTCPSCGEAGTFVSCGPGVERVYDEVQSLFPAARTALITSETVTSPKTFAALSDQIQNNELDILIGTQILAKGHHFPNLTLVGVVDADMGLAGGDLRASERTFQLLHQVMGRAGRQSKKGLAILQSYAPENLIIQALQANDRNRFLQEEMASRRLLEMPPFGRLAALIISGKNQKATYRVACDLARRAPQVPTVTILGPVPAPIAVLRGKYRFRLLVKAPKSFRIQDFLQHWLKHVPVPSTVDVRLDIDPYSFF